MRAVVLTALVVVVSNPIGKYYIIVVSFCSCDFLVSNPIGKYYIVDEKIKRAKAKGFKSHREILYMKEKEQEKIKTSFKSHREILYSKRITNLPIFCNFFYIFFNFYFA